MSKFILDTKPMKLAMHDAIAPLLLQARKTCRSLSEGVTTDWASMLVEWSRDFVALRCEPAEIAMAIKAWTQQSPFFPTFSDIMQQAYGEHWASTTVPYRIPVVEWGLVKEEGTGAVVEVYPLGAYSVEMVKRIAVQSLPFLDERKTLGAMVVKKVADGEVDAEAERLSALYGTKIAAGVPSLSHKPPRPPAMSIRSDLDEQRERLLAVSDE